MKENLFVIATRGRGNKEVYLKCGVNDTFEWTSDIEESYADYDYSSIEKFASNYFKHYKKWYIKEWVATI